MSRGFVALVPSPANEVEGWLGNALVQRDGAVILHVAGAAEDLPRLVSLIEAIEDRAAFDQIVLDAGAGPATESTLAELDAGVPVFHLDRPPEIPDEVLDTLEESRCTVVVVHVDDQAGLCCALAAARLGIAVVRVGGPPRSGAGRVIARLADVLLTRWPLDGPSHGGAVTPDRVCVIGNPLRDLVQRHARAALDAAAWREFGVSPGGYMLGVLTGNLPFVAVEGPLTDLERRFPLVLESPPGYEVPGARLVSTPSFLKRLSLQRTAKAIFTDSARVREEAAFLGVRCHTFDLACAADSPEIEADITPRDRQAGSRAANALVANFARVRLPH